MPTEETTTDTIIPAEFDVTDNADKKQDAEKRNIHQLEVELIELEQHLRKDIDDFKQLEEKRRLETVEIHIGSSAPALTRHGLIIVLSLAPLFF